jgi:NAD(P)-dependent dehydrogenase (short-subunit alcohol dehydrogenase family)
MTTEDLYDCNFTTGCLYRIVFPYAGAKAPVEHFTRAASKEFGARGISVTAVAPGQWILRSSMGRKQMMP